MYPYMTKNFLGSIYFKEQKEKEQTERTKEN